MVELRYVLTPFVIIFAALIILALFSIMAPKPAKKAVAIKAPLVSVVSLAPQDITFDIQSQGNVVPRTKTTLVAEVSGLVTRVADKFHVGGFFKKGERLLTIDDTRQLNKIVQELNGFGNIEIDSDLSIICIAGDLAQNKKGVTSSIFNCIKDIPIRMISYGGSKYNLSFLVKTSDKISVLNLLNKGLFSNSKTKESLLS